MKPTTPAQRAYIGALVNIERLDEPVATVARRCGLLSWFEEGVVSALLGDGDESDPAESLRQIAQLPFVEQIGNRYEFHALSAEGWREH